MSVTSCQLKYQPKKKVLQLSVMKYFEKLTTIIWKAMEGKNIENQWLKIVDIKFILFYRVENFLEMT